MKDIIIIGLLLISVNVCGQEEPLTISADSLPFIISWGSASGGAQDSPPQFVKIDTIHGAVTFLKRGEVIAAFQQAIKIDSVFTRSITTSGGCDMGMGPNVSCLALHYNTKIEVERKTVAIVTKFGKHIDLSKNYTFIPESEMQD